MKKVKIKLEYNGVAYYGDSTETTEEELSMVKKLLKEAAEGNVTYLSFGHKNEIYYFSPEIIKQSILTLIYNDES